MTIHLQKFVDRLRGFESRGARDYTMSINDAKDLHADITRLLIDLQNLREFVAQNQSQEQIMNIEVDGGSFK